MSVSDPATLVFIYYMASMKEREGTFCCWPAPTVIVFTPRAKEQMWDSTNHQNVHPLIHHQVQGGEATLGKAALIS